MSSSTDASFRLCIAVHQCLNENGFLSRSSSRCRSFVVTRSCCVVGVGTGNVMGKVEARDSRVRFCETASGIVKKTERRLGTTSASTKNRDRDSEDSNPATGVKCRCVKAGMSRVRRVCGNTSWAREHYTISLYSCTLPLIFCPQSPMVPIIPPSQRTYTEICAARCQTGQILSPGSRCKARAGACEAGRLGQCA